MVNEQKKPQTLKKKNSQNFSSSSKGSPSTPRFPLHSPTTPNSVSSPSNLNFSPLPKEEEYGNILDELLNKGGNYSNKILNKLLEEKEREIERLETEKEQLLKEKKVSEAQETKQKQLEKTLLHQNKKIEELKNEIRETGEDLLQAEEKNDELKTFLAQERLINRQLEQNLNREMDEND